MIFSFGEKRVKLLLAIEEERRKEVDHEWKDGSKKGNLGVVRFCRVGSAPLGGEKRITGVACGNSAKWHTFGKSLT